MKLKFLIAIFLMAFVFHNCSDGQSKRTNLSAIDFANKTNELPAAPIGQMQQMRERHIVAGAGPPEKRLEKPAGYAVGQSYCGNNQWQQ